MSDIRRGSDPYTEDIALVIIQGHLTKFAGEQLSDCFPFLDGRFHIVNCILVYFLNDKISSNYVILNYNSVASQV